MNAAQSYCVTQSHSWEITQSIAACNESKTMQCDRILRKRWNGDARIAISIVLITLACCPSFRWAHCAACATAMKCRTWNNQPMWIHSNAINHHNCQEARIQRFVVKVVRFGGLVLENHPIKCLNLIGHLFNGLRPQRTTHSQSVRCDNCRLQNSHWTKCNSIRTRNCIIILRAIMSCESWASVVDCIHCLHLAETNVG